MKNDFENELDLIRVKLYEKSRGSGNADVADKTNTEGKRIAETYGIIVVKSDYNRAIRRRKAL